MSNSQDVLTLGHPHHAQARLVPFLHSGTGGRGVLRHPVVAHTRTQAYKGSVQPDNIAERLPHLSSSHLKTQSPQAESEKKTVNKPRIES